MGCICPSRESPQPRNTLVLILVENSIQGAPFWEDRSVKLLRASFR